ncbi:MAG: DUF2188 domain-containing protein [Acholeplasmatales bacterium]|nr:MAG: DUF2188 domain-containing protein [Acholeplasmatales bacterium]
MSLFKRLLKKKTEEVTETQPAITQENADDIEQLKEDARNLTLEDVEKEIDKVTAKDALAFARKKPADAPKKPEPDKIDKPASRYHIKKHDKGWQIIAEDAERAYRVFTTQKEAIDFAKENELDYLLYRVDGTLRQ